MTNNRTGSRLTVSAAVATLLSLAAMAAMAAPPAAPAVTTGADIKKLEFDWDIVPRSNYYELLFKANTGSPFVKLSESVPWRPRAVTSVSAHLLDWSQARYQVRACNFSGCAASAPIPVGAFMADTIGYFKAGRLHNNARFGIATAISEDGNTLAAFTAGETLPDYPKAAIYVFARINGRWRQQARLFPESGVAPFENLGLTRFSEPSLSLSADGNVLAAAMAFGTPGRDLESGGVTIYRRTGGHWAQEHQVIRVQGLAGYVGGLFAEIDHAGEHILFRPGSYADPAEMIVHGPGGWTRQVIQQPPSDLANGYGCTAPRLSGDGGKIAWACTRLLRLSEKQLFVSRPPGWQLSDSVPLDFPDGHSLYRVAIDHDGDTIVVGSFVNSTPNGDPRHHVRVFHKLAGSPGTWETAAPLHAGDWVGNAVNLFGADIALSYDGKLLAILDPRDTGAGVGVLSPPLQAGTEPTGATYIYELRETGPFLRRLLKPNNPIPAGGLFEGKVRFANNGKTLIVSEPDEPGNSSGIDGDRTLGGRPRTGAVWLY